MVGNGNCVYKHEEADCNIINYIKQLIMQGHNHVQVAADDTEIFELLEIALHGQNINVKS